MYTLAIDGLPGQGDVVSDITFPMASEPLPGLLITPACDLQWQKTQFLHFVPCIPASCLLTLDKGVKAKVNELSEFQRSGQEKCSNKKSQAIADALSKCIRTATELSRFFYLPQTECFPDLIADVGCIISIPIDKRDSLRVLARLGSPHREKLSNIVSIYYGRIGTPDYSPAELEAAIRRVASPIDLGELKLQ